MFRIQEQSNYLAKIVKIDNLHPIPDADRIQTTLVDYNSVIIGKDTNIGDVVVYFPVECQINSDLLSYLNLYSDSTQNNDTTQKGFFGKQGRVRCVSMIKGTVKSEGFIIPYGQLQEFLETYTEPVIDTSFDYFNNIQICQKYVPTPARNSGSGVQVKSTNKLKNILVGNQFKFYGDTSHLKQNIHKFNLEDLVVITNKVHGSSFIASYCLVNRRLKWYEKLGLRLGLNIPTLEYGYVWSSGKPKSNLPKGVESESNVWISGNGSFYSEDIWRREFEKIKPVLKKGFTIYGEIIGQGVQGPYTYGVEGTKMLVYKITVTNIDGDTITLDWFNLKKFCEKHQLEHVEEWYVGHLALANNERVIIEEREHIIPELTKQFLDRRTSCGNPDEGICIQRLEDKEWYKLKSFTFLKKESEMLDTITETNE